MIKKILSKLSIAVMLLTGIASLFIRPLPLELALPLIGVNLLCHSGVCLLSKDQHQDDFLFYGGLWSLAILAILAVANYHGYLALELLTDVTGLWAVGVASLRLAKAYRQAKMLTIKENLPTIFSGVVFLGLGTISILNFSLLAGNIHLTIGINLIVAAINHLKISHG